LLVKILILSSVASAFAQVVGSGAVFDRVGDEKGAQLPRRRPANRHSALLLKYGRFPKFLDFR
jgi:hypothetical protein